LQDTKDEGMVLNDDIQAYSDSKEIITYSSAIDIVLSSACRNQCSYCHFSKRKADLVVPYSTIKHFKAARRAGAREANIIAGERPDRFHPIRAKFDVWGFNSYVEYVYTVAELAFLEGLLVNLNIGYLSYNELKYLQEIVSTVEVCLENINEDMLLEGSAHGMSPSKSPAIRLKLMENAGKLNLPLVTGIMIGIGESPEDRIKTLLKIKEIHEEYGNIQSVKINSFLPSEGLVMEGYEGLPLESVLEMVTIAREIMPEDVAISVPINLHENIPLLIKHGVNDLGQIRVYGKDSLFPDKSFLSIEEYQKIIEENNYKLYKRLPIKNSFILAQKYSKKLGQFLDKYKMKLKESVKEDKFVLSI